MKDSKEKQINKAMRDICKTIDVSVHDSAIPMISSYITNCIKSKFYTI